MIGNTNTQAGKALYLLACRNPTGLHLTYEGMSATTAILFGNDLLKVRNASKSQEEYEACLNEISLHPIEAEMLIHIYFGFRRWPHCVEAMGLKVSQLNALLALKNDEITRLFGGHAVKGITLKMLPHLKPAEIRDAFSDGAVVKLSPEELALIGHYRACGNRCSAVTDFARVLSLSVAGEK